MPKVVPMKHMMILIPGVMGSVLQTPDGHDLWALSGQALGQFLITQGTMLDNLALPLGDTITNPIAPDGVHAVRLIEDLYSVPGLIEGAGYSEIHRYIKSQFNVVEGNSANPADNANYFPFPYDWRRDIRAAAHNLKMFIDRQLPIWRKKFGGKNAKVILLAHSLGGLVARYYLDVLGGWENTLVTMTFGTPHRGSINALNMISNGFQVSGGVIKRSLLTVLDSAFSGMFGKLTTAVRSFPSAYQMMPRYPILQANGNWMRIAEAPADVTIPYIDKDRAVAALRDFYLKIDAAYETNLKNANYRFNIVPIIGTRQPTLQSALLQHDLIVPSNEPPPGLDPLLANGDGTVPQVSALPLEMADQPNFQRFFITEHHGWLPNNEVVREGMLDQLIGLVANTTKSLRGSSDDIRPVLSIDLDPLYLAGEEVVVRFCASPARSEGAAAQPAALQDLNVQVKRVGKTAPILQQVVQAGDDNECAKVAFNHLIPGLYRVQARTITSGQRSVSVNGVFEIISTTGA